MNINTLIFDRTQADVDRVKELNAKAMAGTLTTSERTEWGANMKGAYNNGDINRVCSAVRQIADRMIAFPGELEAYRLEKEVYRSAAFDIPYEAESIIVHPKTDWAMTDYMNETAMKTYIEDIATLRGVIPLPGDTPDAPTTGQKMTFQRANDIEKILFNVSASFDDLEDTRYNAIDLSAAAGTNWEKFHCTREDLEAPSANESAWGQTGYQTDPNAALTATGYKEYRMEYDGTRFVYVVVGDPVTIREGIVYNVTSNTLLERRFLSINSAGVQTMSTEARLVTTVTTTVTLYTKGDYISDVHTVGFAYPDEDQGYSIEKIEETVYDEPLSLIMIDEEANYYYYIRIGAGEDADTAEEDYTVDGT